jgi:hypothetical protein
MKQKLLFRLDALVHSHSFIRQVTAVLAGAMIATAGCMLVSPAQAANPAEEMAKVGSPTTVDPKGDSWQVIQNSFSQFAHPEFILRVFLSFALAVGLSWTIAWHPRRSSLVDPIADFEERKALILLGMVGAVVAELSGSSPTLAFVIFGIGALLRFRTVLENPKLTGKAIIVVVVGLACGIGSWAIAVMVTIFSWLLIYWLESHASCRLRIRMSDHANPQPILSTVESLLATHHCRLQSTAHYEDKGQVVFVLTIPAGIDIRKLEAEVRARLRKANVSKIDVRV